MRYGFIPEFIGRLPVVVGLEPLTHEAMLRILTEPRNAIIKQYQKLLALDHVELEFTPDGLEAIAERAMQAKTGARACAVSSKRCCSRSCTKFPLRSISAAVSSMPKWSPGAGIPFWCRALSDPSIAAGWMRQCEPVRCAGQSLCGVSLRYAPFRFAPC